VVVACCFTTPIHVSLVVVGSSSSITSVGVEAGIVVVVIVMVVMIVVVMITASTAVVLVATLIKTGTRRDNKTAVKLDIQSPHDGDHHNEHCNGHHHHHSRCPPPPS